MIWMRLSGMIVALCVATTAMADDDDDHDFARDAFVSGKIVTLASFLPSLEAQFDARLIDAEIEREHGVILYEIKLITATGRLIEVLIDAETGEILTEDQLSVGRDTGDEADDEDDEEDD